MTLSPHSVAIRRVGLGVLFAAELIRLALGIGFFADPAFLPAPATGGPSPLYQLAMTPWLVWLLACVGAAGALGFASRRAPRMGALLALGCAGALFYCHQHVRGQHDESFVQPAAALLGWVVGWGLAWLLGHRGRRDDASARDVADVYGVTAALAFFGATYFNAGLCKLLASGPLWFDPAQLQTVIAMFMGTGEPAWQHDLRVAVMGSEAACVAMLYGTVVVELMGALLPFGRRVRLVAAVALLGMHTGMFLLATIIFWPAVLLLLLFGLPWERAMPGAAADASQSSGSPAEVRAPLAPARAILLATVVTAAVALLPWVTPLSSLSDNVQHPTFARIFEATRSHNSRVIGTIGQPERESTEPLASLGPLRAGMKLPGGWLLSRVEALGDGALLALRRGDDAPVVCDLTLVGPDSPSRPFEVAGLELQYRRTDHAFTEFEPALAEVARLLREAVTSAGASATLSGWLEAAPRAER